MVIKHRARAANKVADALSRPPGTNEGSQDNQDVVVLPDHLFVNAIETRMLTEHVQIYQQHQKGLMKDWSKTSETTKKDKVWRRDRQLVVPEDETLWQEVGFLVHDHVLAGHPGIKKTIAPGMQQFWWPGIKDYLMQYVKGCAICQSTKPSWNKKTVPLFPITPDRTTQPFSTVAIDLIVDLPTLSGHDSIITITDHDVTKAAIFLPCSKTITGEEVASLYGTHVFPHYGAPTKVISNQDTRFMSCFSKELCRQLGIINNMSTAYHPQTDGQSE